MSYIDSAPEVAGLQVTGSLEPHRGFSRTEITSEDLQVLRDTYAADLNDSEFKLFVAVAEQKGLSPLAGQIHAVARGQGNNRKLSIQTSIDGFRLIAQRSGAYAGQGPKEWCAEDGRWADVWLQENPPAAAKATVYRHGFVQPITAVATWREYAQWVKDYKTGAMKLAPMWVKMPALMLAKCAEALALRMAFPEDLSGIYTDDEMAQADSHVIETTMTETRPPSLRDQLRDAWRDASDDERKAVRKWWKGTDIPVDPGGIVKTLSGCPEDRIPEVLDALSRAKDGTLGEEPDPPPAPPTPPPSDGPTDAIVLVDEAEMARITEAVADLDLKVPTLTWLADKLDRPIDANGTLEIYETDLDRVWDAIETEAGVHE